jgi:hypothetical protein
MELLNSEDRGSWHSPADKVEIYYVFLLLPFSAAIQNSLVGGPVLQNVLGTVTSVNQGLLGSGGLLGGGGLLTYGGIFGVVEELSG